MLGGQLVALLQLLRQVLVPFPDCASGLTSARENAHVVAYRRWRMAGKVGDRSVCLEYMRKRMATRTLLVPCTVRNRRCNAAGHGAHTMRECFFPTWLPNRGMHLKESKDPCRKAGREACCQRCCQPRFFACNFVQRRQAGHWQP